MENPVIKNLKERRSIYSIGKDVSHSQDELTALIQDAIKYSPSSFNSQSSRALILFGENHHKLWDTVKAELSKIVSAEAMEATTAKIDNCFRSGFGTVLFFEDSDVVTKLEKEFPLYADNFRIWSEQSGGMAQLSVWTALATEKVGATLQHYNPVIDEAVASEWNIPASWILRAQMPFGSIEQEAQEKAFMDDSQRFIVCK
ncbi:nitroreductase family protein [Vibrio mangrovi]|uniref:Nitroreductase family protein n=1 Tax=Vibrio mangrovi TaxID=474394 RepID=A0A1Y6ISI1_9VIBR|nr:nitroreductase family protein [Vibrio mangrovi]MDW6001349.1 nitroreductase family protein [Vibrio mangrovi]SMS00629.1 Nitroreductase family protein [Vibrio mangrovi]